MNDFVEATPLAGPVNTVAAIRDGEWIPAGLHALAFTGEVLTTSVTGMFANAGVSWLVDHVQPLCGWLDDLAGNKDAAVSFAATISAESAALKRLSSQRVDLDVVEHLGQAAEARDAAITRMLGLESDIADVLDAVGAAATDLAAAVTAVRGFMVGLIAELISIAVDYAIVCAVTLGAAAAVVVPKMSGDIARAVTRAQAQLSDLLTAAANLNALLAVLAGSVSSVGMTALNLARTFATSTASAMTVG